MEILPIWLRNLRGLRKFYCYRIVFSLFLAALALLSSCRGFSTPTATPEQQDKPSRTATSTPPYTPSSTQTPLPSATPTPTPLPTATATPSSTPSPTIRPSPTSEFPLVTALMQANCRYGPGKAYLYAHGLYEGDAGEVHGRNYSGGWLWIKPANLDWHCWVAASVVDVVGDVSTVNVVQTRLPHSTLYAPPENVQAGRDGDLVTVTWEAVWMTEDDDRGYMIEATICQGTNLIHIAVQTDKRSYQFTDESGCSGASGGLLYTVSKYGYTDPAEIPWP